MGSIGLSVYLMEGISILTLNGAGVILSAQTPPLVRVVIQIGMISGVLLVTLTIGRIVTALTKKQVDE
jgi:hypothetical protein